MGRVLLGAGLTAAYFVVQGILILCSGSAGGIGAYFPKAPRPVPRARPVIILPMGTIHIVLGLAVFAFLIMVGLKHHLTISEAAQRLWSVRWGLFFALLALGGGVYALVRPSGMLGWARNLSPEIPEDLPVGLLIVRVNGAGLCFMGLAILFVIVS